MSDTPSPESRERLMPAKAPQHAFESWLRQLSDPLDFGLAVRLLATMTTLPRRSVHQHNDTDDVDIKEPGAIGVIRQQNQSVAPPIASDPRHNHTTI